ncbi:MAG: hypothetical protein HY925_00625 [Elusimicrobia bacterium]|nr:hypothetical protein [Elusimicrobiota bacterium]
MRRLRWALCVLALVSPVSASAELVLRSVAWQLPSPKGAQPRGYQTVERWIQPPSAKVPARPRVVVTVVNRGPKAAEGAVLRYAIAARQAKIGQTGGEGTWTVPFYLAERRVARIGANQVKEVPINDLVLDVFLKKTFRAGYWPDALRIQVMVEPRTGEGLEQRILEQTLPVVNQ